MARVLRYIPRVPKPKEEAIRMARAFIGAVECQVHVDRDLGESWAVTVVPPSPKQGERPIPSLVVKLQGEDREKITAGALEILKKRGQIDRFEL
jgi:hypothetical protein